jgi:hypothetical protein
MTPLSACAPHATRQRYTKCAILEGLLSISKLHEHGAHTYVAVQASTSCKKCTRGWEHPQEVSSTAERHGANTTTCRPSLPSPCPRSASVMQALVTFSTKVTMSARLEANKASCFGQGSTPLSHLTRINCIPCWPCAASLAAGTCKHQPCACDTSSADRRPRL